MNKKRYQVYLNPHSVGVIDEFAEISEITRSRILQEMVEAAASRVGNLLAMIKRPKKVRYTELDKYIGAIKTDEPKLTTSSQRVDDIYYNK